MSLSFASGAIPLAAIATFGAVYMLTPGGRETPVPALAPPVETDESAFPAPERVQRRPVVPEYTYSEQRKLEGASQLASEVDINREDSVYYAGCYDVRAAGAAPLYRGDPGYRSGMDGDNDGVACEPHRGR